MLARAVFWAATLAVLVVAVRSAVVAPIPLSSSIALAVAWASLFAGLLRHVNLGAFVDVLTKGTGRGVALTVDGLPPSRTLPTLLRACEERGVTLAFFVTAHEARARASDLAAAAEAGHAVGLRLLRGVSARSLDDRAALADVLGEPPVFVRVEAWGTPALDRALGKRDLLAVGWSVGAQHLRSRERVTARVREGARDGAVVALGGPGLDEKLLAAVADELAEQRLAVEPLARVLGVDAR